MGKHSQRRDEVGSDNEDMNELGESEDEEDSDNGDYDTKIDITVSSDRIVASLIPNPRRRRISPIIGLRGIELD